MTDYFVHESSYVDEETEIGDGTKIWHFSHVQRKARIGNNCIIGQNVNIGPGVIIGDNVKIQNNVSIYAGVFLENDVFVGPSVVFTNITNPRSFIERKDEFKPTLVKTGATIGANATIICGTTIGMYSLIGAAAVVTKNVLNYSLVFGSPSRRRGWVCRCGNILDHNLYCCICNKNYEINIDGLY